MPSIITLKVGGLRSGTWIQTDSEFRTKYGGLADMHQSSSEHGARPTRSRGRARRARAAGTSFRTNRGERRETPAGRGWTGPKARRNGPSRTTLRDDPLEVGHASVPTDNSKGAIPHRFVRSYSRTYTRSESYRMRTDFRSKL